MSIITGIVGSVQGSGGITITPISSIYAHPGYNNPPLTNGAYGQRGTPYDPGDANHFVNGLVTGHLIRRAYEGYWMNQNNHVSAQDNVTVFDGTVQETLNDPYIAFQNDSVRDGYCLEWKGYWIAPSTGIWNFTVSADDVCWLWLGDAAASPTDSNALCKNDLNANSVSVSAGAWYKIRIRFQEWGGNESLGVWAGPQGTTVQALYQYPDRLCYNGLSDGY
jgi:hypothetical protein